MKTSEKIKALINLLDESDKEIYSQIREELIAYGTNIIPVLEEQLYLHSDSLIRHRIEKIIYVIRYRQIANELKAWCMLDGENLLTPWISLSKIHDPFLDEKTYLALVDGLVKTTWLELNEQATAMEQINILNKIIFDFFGFKHDEQGVINDDKIFINSFFGSKKGNMFSLGLLFLILAERLNIPLQGVSFPFNFALGYRDARNLNTMLFYVNPANGVIFSKDEIDEFLYSVHIKPAIDFYKPCSKFNIVSLLIDNLINENESNKNVSQINQLKDLKSILAHTKKI